jgi:hypothetical protein
MAANILVTGNSLSIRDLSKSEMCRDFSTKVTRIQKGEIDVKQETISLHHDRRLSGLLTGF